MHTRAPDQPRGGRAGRRARFAVALTALTLLAACGSSSKSSSTTSSGGTAASGGSAAAGGGGAAPTGEIKVGMAKGDIDTLDPNRWYFAATWGLANALCSTLVRYDDKPGADGVKIVSGLAEMPTVSADGLQYDFKLKDSKFANGEKITPADIKYTFERLMAKDVDTGTGGYFFALQGQDDYTSGKATEISGITTTDDTITFKLTAPDGSFLNKIALPTTCPVGKDAAYKPDEGVDILKEYASGPYTIDSYTPEQSMTWVRNPGYNAAALGDRGKAEKISFEIGVDPSQAAPKIKAGDIDVYTGNFPTADITTLSNDASLKDRVFTAARPAILTMFLNNTVAPFDNPKVRQAVNYAVNRDQIQRVWGGPQVGTPTDQILPPSVPDYRDYKAYPDSPDLEKAKQLMQESGVTTPITTQLRTRNDVAGFMEVAQVIQANLKELGINVEIQGAPGSVDGAYDADPKNKAPSGLVTFSMDFPDGQSFINLLLDPAKPDFGGSYARFNDQSFIPDYDKVSALTGDARDKAYIDLDEKVMTQAAPWAPLLVPSRFDFVSDRLNGYTYSQAMDAVNYNTLGVSG